MAKERLSKLQKWILESFNLASELKKKKITELTRKEISQFLFFLTQKPYRLYRLSFFEKEDDERIRSKIMQKELYKIQLKETNNKELLKLLDSTKKEDEWRKKKEDYYKRISEVKKNQVSLTRSLECLVRKSYLKNDYVSALIKSKPIMESRQIRKIGRRQWWLDSTKYKRSVRNLTS